MRRHLIVPVVLASAAAWTDPAAADPDYRAAQIIEMFAPAAAPEPEEPATRGVCIGTQKDCRPQRARSASPGFDLMVSFGYKSDGLTAAAKRNLDEFARALQHPSLRSRRFAIEGHTDAKGGIAYNLRLSQRRADAVAAYLAGKGVDRAALRPRGFGKLRPRVADPYDGANRRVEARLAE